MRTGGRRRLRPTLLALEERKLLSTIVVNNPTDTPVAGQIDLRQAIDMANTNGGDEVITFDRTVFARPQTIELTSGQLELSNTSEPITIKGPGAGDLTIDAGGTSRVFAIDPGVTASISGLTVTGGASGGAYVSGGDVLNQGTLTLTGATVSGGSAYSGGGLSNSGTATLVDSTLADNIGNRGAGLFNGGTVTLEDCTVAGNTGVPAGGFESASLGGGLFNWGSLTMIGGSVTGDTANFGSAVYSGYGTVTNLTGTTIRDNPSAGYPGSYRNDLQPRRLHESGRLHDQRRLLRSGRRIRYQELLLRPARPGRLHGRRLLERGHPQCEQLCPQHVGLSDHQQRGQRRTGERTVRKRHPDRLHHQRQHDERL